MILEGVIYHRYMVSFRLRSGERRTWVRWAPNAYFMREQLVRELDARDVEPGVIVPGSGRIMHDVRGCTGCDEG
jgi:hypothetical protein